MTRSMRQLMNLMESADNPAPALKLVAERPAAPRRNGFQVFDRGGSAFIRRFKPSGKLDGEWGNEQTARDWATANGIPLVGETDLNPGHALDGLSWTKFRAALFKNGTARLYRVMNLDRNPVDMIAEGHDHLGLHWTYDLAFIKHGGHHIGYGGSAQSWFYFAVDVTPEVVDWMNTRLVYVGEENFEREVVLLPGVPVKLVGIETHDGKALDCSKIAHMRLHTGTPKT